MDNRERDILSLLVHEALERIESDRDRFLFMQDLVVGWCTACGGRTNDDGWCYCRMDD